MMKITYHDRKRAKNQEGSTGEGILREEPGKVHCCIQEMPFGEARGIQRVSQTILQRNKKVYK